MRATKGEWDKQRRVHQHGTISNGTSPRADRSLYWHGGELHGLLRCAWTCIFPGG
jgi:hypothetical protein